MEYYTELLPLEILEDVFIYTLYESHYLDMLDSPGFDKIKFTPYLVKRMFDVYDFEIMNKNLLLYTLNLHKNYKEWSDFDLGQFVISEFDKSKSLKISCDAIMKENFTISVWVRDFHDVSFF